MAAMMTMYRTFERRFSTASITSPIVAYLPARQSWTSCVTRWLVYGICRNSSVAISPKAFTSSFSLTGDALTSALPSTISTMPVAASIISISLVNGVSGSCCSLRHRAMASGRLRSITSAASVVRERAYRSMYSSIVIILKTSSFIFQKGIPLV